MTNQYSVIPLSIILFLLYLLSYLSSRYNIISVNTHRKIWNILLLIVFLVAGTIGIILALQVNYKIKLPFIDEILIYHVDFGICLVIIALFHFFWHIKYFKNILIQVSKRKASKQYPKEKTAYSKTNVIPGKIELFHKLPVIITGLSALITQIIMLREFISVFYGNELVIGIVLANWMLITGMGSYFGKFSNLLKNKNRIIIISIISIAILPVLTVFLISLLRNVIFPTGAMLGIIQIFLSSFVLLLPFCFLSGFMFTLFSHLISEEYKQNYINKVYSYEAIGSIIGGILFNFLFVFFLNTFQSLLILLVIDLAIAFYLSIKYKKRIFSFLIVFLGSTIIFLTLFFNLDNLSRELLYKNQELVFHKNTPYGDLVITKRGDQLNFYENNLLLFTTNNPSNAEEAAHYAMVQHSSPKNVLLLSGGISGIIDEILKYDVSRIDYIEINPSIIEIGKKYGFFVEKRQVNVINQDARLFIKNTLDKYDVVLINLPEPNTAQINRFYTSEFFSLVKDKLSPNGIICLSLMSTGNYVSNESVKLNSVIYNTIKQFFNQILIVPGEKNYFIASDQALNINIAQLIQERGIENIYVNQYYLDDQLIDQRSQNILQNIDKESKINRDFIPLAYFFQIRYWLSYFSSGYWFFAGFFLLLLIICLSRLKPISLGLFTGGFAASSIEILLLISFQIIYGYVFRMTGIIITIFMAGIAIGALYREKIIPIASIKNFIRIQFIIGLYSILLPFVLILLKTSSYKPYILHIIFFLITFFIALIIGIEFSVATGLQKKKISEIAAELYSIDLLGSAIGALLVSVFIIPVLGIINVGIILGLMNFGSALVSYIKRKQYT